MTVPGFGTLPGNIPQQPAQGGPSAGWGWGGVGSGYTGGATQPPPSGGGSAPPSGGGGGAAPPATGGGTTPGGGQTTDIKGFLNPGAQHPFSNDPFQLIAPPPGPGPAYNNFLPSVFRDPYLSGMNVAAQVGTAAGKALPNASQFQQDLYSPNLTQMEQSFLGSSAELGMRGLNQTLNRIEGQFENSPMHGSLGGLQMDAANQFAAQMMNTGSQMGMTRQGLAAQSMPFTFGFPMQASGFGQQSSEGLYNMMTQGMYGDMAWPASLYGQYPFISPTILQNTGGGGGGKGK